MSDHSIERRLKDGVKKIFSVPPLALIGRAYAGEGSILMYHRVLGDGETPSPDPVNQTLEVHRSAFEEQMELVSRKNPVALPELVEALKRGRTAAGSIAVTFDDGYRDNFTEALPVLERHGIPATIYIAPALIDGSVRASWYERENFTPSILSWTELRELSRHPLITIGAHSVTHPSLSSLSDAELSFELSESRRILEEKLGIAVLHFAYPFGRPSNAGRREFEAASNYFISAVTTRYGHIHPGHRENLTALPRIPVQLNDTIETFERKLGGIDAIFASNGRRLVTI